MIGQGEKMPLQLEINDEFAQAVDLIENSRQNLFITGKAGTGKSTLLDYCYNHSQKNLVLLAPTGVAALNVRGQTIHRFFGFPVNISVQQIENKEFKPRAVRIFKNMEAVVIDEVSMLRADLLDCIDAFLRLYGPETGRPFGGVQMIFVGDLYQLPPVIGNHEQEFFALNYASPYFFSAAVFRQIPLQVIELKKVYRQKDKDFITLLNHIRNNRVTGEDIAQLNSRVGAALNGGAEDFKISLTTTNRLADEINAQCLDELDGAVYTSEAEIEGDFGKETYPTAKELDFKIGSQIMFLNNDAKNRWVNGSVGRIVGLKERDGRIRYVEVRLQAGQRLVAVFPFTWEMFKYKLEGTEIISESVGSFTQYPFKLAWAVTIHKSQGKTFDNVEIDIGTGTFATGQLYVALSRCTSFDGISLKKKILPRHILIDERINEFMSNYSDDVELSELLKRRKLDEAIKQQREVEIIYRKTDGKRYRRRILPQKIFQGRLLAFCQERQEPRTFLIERILNVKNPAE